MLANSGTLDGTRILSAPMLDYVARNQTGDRPNDLMAYAAGRGWQPWPANIGTGFFVRGEGVSIGPVGVLSGPRAVAGLGSGSAAFIADPDRRLAVSLLSVGTMPDTDHFARMGRLTDMIIAAL
jgi:CubicO group peptidase (beta-lactamase class C family)